MDLSNKKNPSKSVTLKDFKIVVTPPGFEPGSKEPESSILSI